MGNSPLTMNMENRREIIGFVRHTLGCKCPDEVFEQIEYQDGETLGNTSGRRITMGGRLLVYVWETNDPSLMRSHLPAVLSRGRRERDRRGLNRFRAVIATDDVDSIEPVAQQLFHDLMDKDDRVYLHVIHADDVPNLG